MNKTILVIGIIILLIGAGVVSTTGYIAKESNPIEIYFKMDSPTVLLDENFSGTFPPEGWETGFFDQNNSSCCDSEPPCVRGKYSGQYVDNFMTSKAIDASNYEKCIIKFYFGANFYGHHVCVYLKYRRNETSPWIDITPWSLPMGEVCEYYEVDIAYDPEGCGESLQIKWEYLGYYYYYLDAICIDDVKILGIPINNPPSKPTIDGPISGEPNTEYDYTFVSTDPEEDAVMYNIEWGDDDTEWTEYGDSGVEVTLKHTWEASGKYSIKAQAIDIHGAESEWAELEVTMPRDKATNNMHFWSFIEQFPLLERLYFLFKM
jgi:hypothetical protein